MEHKRQRRKRCLDETGQIIPVIHFADVEIVLRTAVGWSQDNFLQQSFARLCNLDVEVIVTDKAEENAVAISAPVPHHLFHGNLPGAGALVDDELYKVRIASHIISVRLKTLFYMYFGVFLCEIGYMI